MTASAEDPLLRPPAGLTTRPLTATDLPALLTLYRLGLASVAEGVLAEEDPAHFPEHLGLRGETFGSFKGSDLVAYSVLGLPRTAAESFLNDLPPRTPKPTATLLAHMDGTVVHPDWRGAGLQHHLTRLRLHRALACGRQFAISHVSPFNPASITNVLRGDMALVRLMRKYGGHWRYVGFGPIKGANGTAPAEPPPTLHWVRLEDLDAQQALFAKGAQAIALDAQSEGEAIKLGFNQAP